MTAKKKAKKIVVKRVEKVAPDKHIVELEVHDAPEPPIELPLTNPMELELELEPTADAVSPAETEPKRGFWDWLTGA